MKVLLPGSFLAAAGLMVGCQAQPKQAAPSSGTAPSASVLDVSAPRTVHQPSVYEISPSVPRAATPVAYAAPASATPAYLPPDADANYVAPAGSPAPTPGPVITARPNRSSARTYVVKKGDTLFRIAKEHYGSGGQWRRITEANPGLSPATLKAGQKLVMP